MIKISLQDIPDKKWTSPKGVYGGSSKEISVALGREPTSTDLMRRHPFDVEICTIPPGKKNCPFHSHSAQWEFYQVISGAGAVRHEDGVTPITVGDALIFPPGKPHQVINDSAADLVLTIVADNPVGETCHYPDSGKWMVRSPEKRLVRPENLDYYDGEE